MEKSNEKDCAAKEKKKIKIMAESRKLILNFLKNIRFLLG